MRPFRLAFFALLIALTAHAAIRVTPEMGIVDPVRAPSDGEQGLPVVATDGEQFLVLWINARGVFVARVDAEGRLVSSRLAVPRAAGDALTTTWTGSAYLVTWNDFTKAARFYATFSKTGDLLSGPVAITDRTAPIGVASNGHRTILLYAYLDGIRQGVRAAIFDADGRLIRTDVTVPNQENGASYPRIASDGHEFALVWTTLNPGPTSSVSPLRDLHFRRMDEDGAAIGSPIDVGSIANGPEQRDDLGFSFGGGRYAVAAFQFHRTGVDEESRLMRFVVDARGGSVTALPTIDTINGSHLNLLWSGRFFVAFWSAGGVVTTLPFSGFDESIAPTLVPTSTDSPAGSPISMVSNGHQVLVAWSQDSGLYYGGRRSEVYSALFDTPIPSGRTPGAPTLLSTGWSRQVQPLMASSPAGSLVVWIEDGNTSRQLLGRRTDATGAFIDAAPFEIARDVRQAAVVFAGEVYVVVWQKSDVPEVLTRTVSLDATLGPPVSFGPGGSGVTAASNGNTTLVVFSENQSARLVAYRFDALGRQIDTRPIDLDAKGGDPQAASNGTDFFVAWNSGTDWSQFPSANLVDIFGTRITPAGTVDAAPLAIANSPRDERLYAVASDGRDYLVAYQLDQYANAAVATKRVLREGQLDGTTAADDGTILAHGAAYSIALSGDATGYWSAYAAGYWDEYSSTGNSNLIRLDKRGMPTSSAVTFTGVLSYATIGRLPGGGVRILYARPIDDGIFAGTTRILSRFAADDGLGDAKRRAARH